MAGPIKPSEITKAKQASTVSIRSMQAAKSKNCPTCGVVNGASSDDHSEACRTSGWSRAYDLAMLHAAKLNAVAYKNRRRSRYYPSSLACKLVELVSGKNPTSDPEVVLATLHGCPKELR